MNKQMLLIWVVLIILVGAGVYAFSQTTPHAIAPSESAATTTESVVDFSKIKGAEPNASTQPPKKGPTFEQLPALRTVTVSESTLVSTSSHPILTGTANITSVGLIIYNSEDVGIVGSWSIPVEKGGWSYPVPIELKKGTYTVQMIGAEYEVKKTLTIQ